MSKFINLSNEQKKVINNAVKGHIGTEVSDKDLFDMGYSYYKGVKKAQRGAVTTVLKKEVERSSQSDNVTATIMRIFKVSRDYCDMQVITKFDNLEYSNIRGLVLFFKFLEKNYNDKVTTVREQIKGLYEEGMSTYRYNNTITSTITKLKQEYKAREVEGEEMESFNYSKFNAVLKKHLKDMSKAQVLELMNELNDYYDVIEEQEVSNGKLTTASEVKKVA